LIEFFVKGIPDSSLKDESNASPGLIVASADLIYEHTKTQRPVHRGSTRPRRDNTLRDRDGGNYRLYQDYIHPTKPVFMEAMFWRRYRISRDLFLIIVGSVRDYDPYWICKLDATGKLDFTSYQKCSAALCMLVYRVPGDILNQYLRIRDSTCLDAMCRFYRALIAVVGDRYLREPTFSDTTRQMSVNEAR
jgi:hypothetical protein